LESTWLLATPRSGVASLATLLAIRLRVPPVLSEIVVGTVARIAFLSGAGSPSAVRPAGVALSTTPSHASGRGSRLSDGWPPIPT
jgi:hypothetical protein